MAGACHTYRKPARMEPASRSVGRALVCSGPAFPPKDHDDHRDERKGIDEEHHACAQRHANERHATIRPPRSRTDGSSDVERRAVQRDRRGQLRTRHELRHDGLPGRAVHRGAHAQKKRQDEQRPRTDDAGHGERAQDRRGCEHPAGPEQEQRDVDRECPLRPSRQAEQQHRQAGGGLHEGDQQGRGRQRRHQPRPGGILHPGTRVRDDRRNQPIAEKRTPERRPRGAGFRQVTRVSHAARELQASTEKCEAGRAFYRSFVGARSKKSFRSTRASSGTSGPASARCEEPTAGAGSARPAGCAHHRCNRHPYSRRALAWAILAPRPDGDRLRHRPGPNLVIRPLMQHLHAYWRMDYIEAPKGPRPGIHSRDPAPARRRSRRAYRASLPPHLPAAEPLSLQRRPSARGPVSRGRGSAGAHDRGTRGLLRHIDLGRGPAPHALHPDGFNIGFNLGSAAGAGIPRTSACAHRAALERRHELHAGRSATPACCRNRSMRCGPACANFARHSERDRSREPCEATIVHGRCR